MRLRRLGVQGLTCEARVSWRKPKARGTTHEETKLVSSVNHIGRRERLEASFARVVREGEVRGRHWGEEVGLDRLGRLCCEVLDD